MTDIYAAMTQAKAAMAARDFETALATLQTVDLDTLEPRKVLAVVQHISKCLAALGRAEEYIVHHRRELSRLRESHWLNPDVMTHDSLDTALLLSVGAHDPVAVRKYVRFWMGEDVRRHQDFKVSPIRPLAAWCERHGLAIAPLDAAQDVVIPDTTGLGRALTYRTRPTWHAVIPQAEIIGGWDYVIAPGGEVLNGANYLPPNYAYAFLPHVYYGTFNLVAHVWPEQCTHIDEDALFLSTPERHHYGHWITDFLTRLRVWKGYDERPRKLVISAQLPTKHRELLACFGVTRDDLIECEIGQRYTFRSLRVVQTSDASEPNPQNMRFLREGFKPPPPSSTHRRTGRKLFLVREAGTRGIGNTAEVDALFREFGIEKVNPAKLSYDEQKSIFADTSLVIGAFGTELYCAYNMRPDSSMIELIWDTNHATVYGPLCHMLGLRHHLMQCPRSGKPAKTSRDVDRDLMIDCGELRRYLAAAV